MSQFSRDVCKRHASNMTYIWRMNDCIVGLGISPIALFFFFIFLSVLHVNSENLCYSFLRKHLS